MSISREKIILSLVIFSHGCEEFGVNFSEPELNFYTNNVRVFSRACVPGLPSITSSSSHLSEIAKIMEDCQSNPTVNTKEVLCSHMSSIKPNYIRNISTSAISNPTLIAHQDKSCNVTTFLYNKSFDFENTEIISDQRYGIFIVDIRKQIISDDGVSYKLIFNPGRINQSSVNYYNLIDKEAMKNFINGTLKKKKKVSELKSLYDNLFFDYKSDLIKIYNFCIECGIDYLNIVDNSCRLCAPGITSLNPSSINEIYNMEQSVTSKKVDFGGKKSKKCKKGKKRTRRFKK